MGGNLFKENFLFGLMVYKAIKRMVRVGYWYSPQYFGARYAWQLGENYYSGADVRSLARGLRELGVEPFQIDNIGTDYPFRTGMMSEKKLDELVRVLAQPKILVAKLPLSRQIFPRKISEEYKINLNTLYEICIGNLYYECKLSQVVPILEGYGCTIGDVWLRKKTSYGYGYLGGKERFYILGELESQREK